MSTDQILSSAASQMLNETTSEESGLSERHNSAATGAAVVGGNGQLGFDTSMLQALQNMGDEGMEAVLSTIASNPEYFRGQRAENFATVLTDASATERGAGEQILQSWGEGYSRLNARHDEVQRMGMQPWEMQTTVVSLGAAVGQLINMLQDSGLINMSPQLSAFADSLVEKGENWQQEIAERAPGLGMDEDSMELAISSDQRLEGLYDFNGLNEAALEGMDNINELTDEELIEVRSEMAEVFEYVADQMSDMTLNQRQEFVDRLMEQGNQSTTPQASPTTQPQAPASALELQ